jgi:hypothetical protein
MKKTLYQCTLAVLAGVCVALMFTQLPACSALKKAPPECGEIEVGVMRTPRGILFVLDEEGLQALNDRTRAIQRGECRLSELER